MRGSVKTSVKRYEYFLPDELSTVEMGRMFGALLADTGATLYLQGTLGAGKTTFCRGVLSAFGYSGPVKSPTYTLVEPYHLNGQTIYHFDLYRLGDPEELEFMGARDYFNGVNLALVEWPGRGRGFLPLADLEIDLKVAGEGRKLEVTSETDCGASILSSLEK